MFGLDGGVDGQRAVEAGGRCRGALGADVMGMSSYGG